MGQFVNMDGEEGSVVRLLRSSLQEDVTYEFIAHRKMPIRNGEGKLPPTQNIIRSDSVEYRRSWIRMQNSDSGLNGCGRCQGDAFCPGDGSDAGAALEEADVIIGNVEPKLVSKGWRLRKWLQLNSAGANTCTASSFCRTASYLPMRPVPGLALSEHMLACWHMALAMMKKLYIMTISINPCGR